MVTSSERIAAERKLKLPFGDWELDAEKANLWPLCTPVNATGTLSLGVYKDAYLVKIIENRPELGEDASYAHRLAALPKEICMMVMAGEDCTLQPVGRIFENGFLCGYIQPLGTSITRRLPEFGNFSNKEKILAPPRFLPSAKQEIDALAVLVDLLHSKGIIHGDIKPSNLISTKDTFRLLFCDFGSADLEGSEGAHISDTVQYISPFRASPANRVSPVTRADDLYAAGITMWELYTGCSSFDGTSEDAVEDVVAAGFQPDVYVIDDPGTMQFVASYLERGNRGLPSVFKYQSFGSCVVAHTKYACCASGRHTYKHVVHCQGCLAEGQCQKVFRVLGELSNIEANMCPECL